MTNEASKIVSVALRVHAVSDCLPDADTDVLIFDQAHDQAQLGAYVGSDEDGLVWVNAQGEGVLGVHHWAELPRLKL